MDKSNFASDLDKLNQNLNFESNKGIVIGGKRKADEISQNPYEDNNRELRELYFLRKQMREKDNLSQDPNLEKTLIDLSNCKKISLENNIHPLPTETKLIEEVKMEKENISLKGDFLNVVGDKSQANQISQISKNPVMWINKLRIYPQDFLLDHFITFRQMMYEDLLLHNPKEPNPPRTLQAAFMTTFGYSSELIENFLKGGVRLVLADEWNDIKEPRIERNYGGYPNFTLIRSPKDPTRKYTGAFHPKIWLLRFPKFLRIVISSGNLTKEDWTTWSNCLWFKDFQKKSTLNVIPEKKVVPPGSFDFDGDFIENLKSFIQNLMPNKNLSYKDFLEINIDDYLIQDIDIVLIASIPGRHNDQDFEKYGHRRVGAVLEKIGFVDKEKLKTKNLTLTYQTSSIGNLDEKFLKEILSSFLPNYLSLEDLKAEKKPRGKKIGVNLGSSQLLGNTISNKVRVVFPTREYVDGCIEGPDYSGCLILNSDMYQKDTFCKDIFYQFQGTEDYAFHEGIIPHLKVFIVADENGEIDDDTYIYFGSHNFSPSAWGRYEKDCTQMSISNTELGVLIPPRKNSKAQKTQIIKNLPFRFPPKKYSKGQVPWMHQVHYRTQG